MELIGIARTSLTQAHQVSAVLQETPDSQAQRVCDQLTQFLPLVEQALDQAIRRVLKGEAVPASAKGVSLFEPHTQILQRGKAPPHETEFGHKITYAEVEAGLVSHWQVIATGNPPDDQLLPPLLWQHRKRFGHAPHLLAGDRGFFSLENERLARRMGVKQISIPHHGRRTARRRTREKKRWFKEGQRFRNGIEGRISVLKRTVQLARCPYHGLDGFERWVGWGILVANLVVIARALRRRRRCHRHQEM